jgi:hypothetical protein
LSPKPPAWVTPPPAPSCTAGGRPTATTTRTAPWRPGFTGGYKFEDNGARFLHAYEGFFFYATGATPAMHTREAGIGSRYMAAIVDSTGDPLHGGKNYHLHLSKNLDHRAGLVAVEDHRPEALRLYSNSSLRPIVHAASLWFKNTAAILWVQLVKQSQTGPLKTRGLLTPPPYLLLLLSCHLTHELAENNA